MPERVFFVTDRNVISEIPGQSDFGNGHPSQPEQLRVGEALVDIPDGYFSDDPPEPASVTAYPENLSADPPLLGSEKLYEEMLDILEGQEQTGALFYIHGYGTGFKEGLSFVAQLQHNMNTVSAQLRAANANVEIPRVQAVIFSWPSEGRLVPWISYFDDRAEARMSQVPLARAIGKLKSKLDEMHIDRVVSLSSTPVGARFLDQRMAFKPELKCDFKVHLMAQSMGNYVLRFAIQELRKNPDFRSGLPRVFDQIFLCSADEDTDTLDTPDKLRLLPDMAARVTVYANRNDRALLISENTKQLSGRLGREGPDRDPDLIKLSLVDVTGVLAAEKNDWPHHYYNRLNPVVQRDVLYCMSGQDLDLIPTRALVTQPRQIQAHSLKRLPGTAIGSAAFQ